MPDAHLTQGEASGSGSHGRTEDAAAASGSARRVRRRTGLKRSRTGCGTCKRRGKKCDEEWNDDGACQRCVTGEFGCTGRTEPPTSATANATPSARQAQRSTSSSSTPPTQEVVPDLTGRSPPSVASGLVNVQNESLQSSSALQHVQISPSTAIAPAHTTIPTGGTGTHHAPLPAAPTSFANPTITSHLNSYVAPFFHGFPAPQPPPMHDWTNFFAPSMPVTTGFASQPPPAFLSAPVDGSVMLDNSALSWNNLSNSSDIWNDLAFSFITSSPSNESVSAPALSGTDKQAPHSQLGAYAGVGDPRIVFMNGEKPMRQGVSLAEIYARVVESWLIGLPSTTRDYARARILALNDNNSVLRNVRYAVSAAYIFLFASDRKGGDNPQPKLVELAWRGAGIVDGQSVSAVAANSAAPSTSVSSPPLALGASSQTKGRSKPSKKRAAAGDNEASTDATASRRLRLYVDHVSTPFAADLESRKWTEDAVQELREVIVTQQAQLSDLLWGVIDLQLVEFIRGGAAPSYNMLALGDRLVRSAMGDNHPPITLSRLRTSDTLSLRFYALSDISRCIVQRGRKTIFNFWTDVGDNDDDSVVQSAENGDEEPWATYLGLPDSIVILLAEVVNLCAELSSSSTTSIKAQADELEAALRGWQSQTFTTRTGDLVDSAALVSRTIAGELWRLSALILLYQSVHRVGGLHPVLRRAQTEILSLLDSIVRLPNGDLWGFIALPAFLAAALSITEADRQRAMQHLQRPGPERVWLDNIALVEKLWEEVDDTGKLPDWHDKMTREGLSVAFF